MHNLLKHITDREVDDEVGGAVDDNEEVAYADQNRDLMGLWLQPHESRKDISG